jgi:dihydroxyacetone kinase-like predicted kinase
MNPSTEDILNAIDRTPAETVFVLPNNKNIIMAAEQCIDLTEKKVVVLPTKTVPQGITAIFAFDPDADVDTNAAAMIEAAGTVTTMSVTYAARDSVFDGMEIKKGDYLGMVNGKVLEVERSLADCIGKMADEGLSGTETYLNVFYGEGVTEEQAAEAQTLLSEHLPDAEINVINGGQPVYYFVISAE